MNGTSTDPRRCRELGRREGLAAGLTAVLDGLDPAAVAPGGVALLPTSAVAGGAEVLPHPFAAREGLALVRFPTGVTAAAGPGAGGTGAGGTGAGGIGFGGIGFGPGLTGVRAAALTAVRTGVLGSLLDAAVERLGTRTFGGLPLIERQFVAGALADVVVEIELATGSAAQPDAPAEAVRAQHERLTEAGWTVTRLFGAEGYVVDHPVRSLHLSALTADLWLARPDVTERRPNGTEGRPNGTEGGR